MKKKIALLALLLAFVLCFSLAACQPDNPDNPDPGTPAEKVYKIAVSGNAARTLTTGETDTITWTVTCDGQTVTEEAEVTVGGSAVTLSDKTATSVKITAAQAGNARVTIKLTAHTDVVANVTYSVSKPSFFGNHNGNWAISDTKVSVDGGQSTILTREKGKTWMFSAEVDITDYSSTETIAIGSFLNTGNNALWFGLRNSDGNPDGRFTVYVRNFLDGWGKATHDKDVAGYTKYTGTSKVKFVLLRDGNDYYYNIDGMFGKFTDNHDVETYAGFQTQNQKIEITNFALETDATAVKTAIATVYPEGGVGAISISGPATLVPQIVSGDSGVQMQFTAKAYADGNEIPDQNIVWTIESTLGDNKAAVTENGLVSIEPQTEGTLTVKATLGKLSDEITFTVIKQELVEENAMFIAKGGVTTDGDNGIVFSPDYVGSATISSENEKKFNSDYTYGATLKQKVTGNFSIEFTVSDYMTKSATPKLMFSLGSDSNNFFVVYGEQTRIEAFVNRNNNGFLQGNWYQGEGMKDMVNVSGSTRYKIAVEGGMYAVYVKVGSDWQKLTIKQDGNAYGMVRSYEDFRAEREIVIGANALSCRVSDVVVTNGSANDEYDYIQNGMLSYSYEYDFNSATSFSVGFQATDWEGRNGSTVAKFVDALPASFTVSYKLKFASAMTDAKFAIVIGDTSFIINNKLSGGDKALSATRLNGNDWGKAINKNVTSANDQLTVTITRDANGKTCYYVNDIKVSEDTITATNMSVYTFCPSSAPDEVTNKGCKATVTDFVIGEYAAFNTWKVAAENIAELKINATADVNAEVKHDGAVVANGYTTELVSANDKIVKIVDGKLVGVAAGKTTITINVKVGDDIVATAQIEVTVPEIHYTTAFTGIDGDTVTIKKYDTLQLVPSVTADIQGYTPEFTVTLDKNDFITMSDSYLVTAGDKEGETTVTIAVTGTEITKSIKIVVSSEVKHNYVLTTELTDNEIFAGDGTTIASRLADNGQSVSGATFACEISHSDILAIADNAITTVEAAVSADTTVTITVKASVDGEVVATKEITIVVKKTTYELTVNGNTTIELEYGKDSASVTFTATRNGVAMDNPVVNVTLPEGGLLEYANGTFTAKKGGNGVVKFVLGDNLASKNVEYTVIANLLSSTRKRGNVAVNGNNVTIADGNSGIAATYPAKVWKIGGTVSYNEFGDQSGATVIGFTSGKDNGDTFGGTLLLGITSGDVKGIRYIEWFQGWGHNMKWINVDGYHGLDMSVVYAATNNKHWELIRINDDYYFTYGDFYGKITDACSEATFPGIFAQFGCNFSVKDVTVDYNEETVRATAAAYAKRTPYSVSVAGGAQHTVGTDQTYSVTIIPAISNANVTWSITTNLSAGTAAIDQNGKVTLSADAKGSYIVKAAASETVFGTAEVTTTGERIFTENDDFVTYGGVNMKGDDSGYKIVFADKSKDGVADECNWSDSRVYTANYKKTVQGDFTVEFTVSNYVAGDGYAKLALSVQGGRTQFYVAHNDQGYRVETYTMCVWKDGGYSDGGTWASTDFFAGFDPAAAHTYKIQCVNGRFHIYVDGTEYLIKTDNGSLTYAARNYDDWTSERQLRFASKNCTAEVSNIAVTKQSTEDVKYYGFFGYNDTYDKATDTLTLTMYKQGWNIKNVPFVVTQPTASHTVEFDVKFGEAMTDAKLGLVVGGNHAFWIENKLSQSGDNSVIHVAGKDGSEWGDSGWKISANKTIHFVLTITLNDAGKYEVSLTIQAEGVASVTTARTNAYDGCKLSFKVFNENNDDMAKTVSVSNLVVTAK